jgi:hypothetical protein
VPVGTTPGTWPPQYVGDRWLPPFRAPLPLPSGESFLLPLFLIFNGKVEAGDVLLHGQCILLLSEALFSFCNDTTVCCHCCLTSISCHWYLQHQPQLATRGHLAMLWSSWKRSCHCCWLAFSSSSLPFPKHFSIKTHSR